MNIPTIIGTVVIAAIFVAIVVNEYKKKKNGKICRSSIKRRVQQLLKGTSVAECLAFIFF